jgi:3-isopropylmalate/(R)-2-methylmalate dehydratase small subunit
MKPFTVLRAVAAPLPLANLSTDDIFPSLGATGRSASSVFDDPADMGPNAFGVMRWNLDRTPREEFILNRPPWNEAEILIARDNFGCGSSREHAVWCLGGIGIRCVIAPSFGDIFYGNCFKNGMLPVTLPADDVEQLLAVVANPGSAVVEVSLVDQKVTDANGGSYPFEVGSYRRDLLLEGLDEIGASARDLPKIEQHDMAYFARRPWLAAKP